MENVTRSMLPVQQWRTYSSTMARRAKSTSQKREEIRKLIPALQRAKQHTRESKWTGKSEFHTLDVPVPTFTSQHGVNTWRKRISIYIDAGVTLSILKRDVMEPQRDMLISQQEQLFQRTAVHENLQQFLKCSHKAPITNFHYRSIVVDVYIKCILGLHLRRKCDLIVDLQSGRLEHRMVIYHYLQWILLQSNKFPMKWILNVHPHYLRGTQRHSTARPHSKSRTMPQVYVDVASAQLRHAVPCCAV